jgi:hypothetical protein
MLVINEPTQPPESNADEFPPLADDSSMLAPDEAATLAEVKEADK